MSKPYGLYVAPHYIEVILNYGNATDVLEPAVKLGFDERLFNIECEFTTQIPSKNVKTQYRLQCRNHGRFPHYALIEQRIIEYEEIHKTFDTKRQAMEAFTQSFEAPILHESPGDGLRFDAQTRTVIDPTLIAPYRCTPQLLLRTRRVYTELVSEAYPHRKGFIYQAPSK